MPYVGKKPANIIATAVDTTTGTFSGTLDVTGAFTSVGIDDNASITAITIDANSRVGIGTSTIPTADSVLTIRKDGAANEFNILSGTSSASVINMGDSDDYNIQRIKADNTDNSLHFQTNNSEKMRITSTGNVGIGTSTPAHNVEIVTTNAGSVNDSLQIRNNATSTGTGSRIRFINSTDASSDANGASISSVRNGDDNDLVFETENSEAMRIDHSGNVGIGTTSPTSMLTISAGVQGVAGGSDAAVRLINNFDNPINEWVIEPQRQGLSNTGLSIRDVTDGRTDMVFDGSGRVGIGTSTPDNTLHVHTGSAGAVTANVDFDDLVVESNNNMGMSFLSPNNTFQQIGFGDADDNDIGRIVYQHTNDSMQFNVNGSERVRIDSSGNLLVGTTSINPADNNDASGSQLSSIGSIQASVSNATPAIFNRGNDGTIIGLLRAGVSVGSIGVVNTDQLTIGTSDGSEMGLRFDGDLQHILPTNSSGAKKDALADLGSATARWRNIYFSGGVYLGGTGSANKLDDYEEGTWTPVLEGSGTTSGVAYSRRQGRYTKVGDKVTANFHIVLSSEGTIGSTAKVSGLPFIGVASPLYQVATIMSGNMAIDKDQTLTGMQYAGNAFIYLMIQESDLALTQVTGNGSFKDNSEIVGSVTYFTDS